MTRDEFQKYIHRKLIVLDGATGSNLMKKGMVSGACPEKWILEHEDVFLDLQRSFVEAGSQILYAPTFTANRVKLREYGLENEIENINTRLVLLSKKAAGGKALVAGDMTMTGIQLYPIGNMQLEELIAIYKEQAAILIQSGVDCIVVETMMSLQETRAAIIAIKEIKEDFPVMASLTFKEDGKTFYGTDAKTAAVVLSHLGVVAVGINCSTGPDRMLSLVRDMREVTDIPIIVKPNAGLPALDENGNTIYDMDADSFAKEMEPLIAAGAGLVGGCCGTTPEYIKKLAVMTKKIEADSSAVVSGNHESLLEGKASSRVNEYAVRKSIRHLTSERMTVSFGLEDTFLIVGERINPTGKKKLQAELREGSFDMITKFAEEQEADGAKILDVNMGMSGIDEKKMMLRAIEEISMVSSLPLSIDSSHIDVIESALRHYPGRALINSISLEEEKFHKLLPIAKKYGAMFILLPLSDAGLPKDLEEKTGIIDTIVEKALSFGMTKEDIIVDGLVTTVGANKEAARETLDTIAYCKEKGLATTCGLSNISFGLPERIYVNAAFLTMAIQRGLTMAIANPSQDLLVCGILASDLLLNKEGADIAYIEGIDARRLEAQTSGAFTANSGQKGEKAEAGTVTGVSSQQDLQGIMAELYEAVLKGKKSSILASTKQALEEGHRGQDILDSSLLPAINQVGELFDKGKYFLPQLIASAEAMKKSIDFLEPYLAENRQEKALPTIVIATVKGDIHDIGKNLVALMLKNYGFRVIDLGKDVPREVIVEAAQTYGASIIALSALMTTTMQEMREVILLVKERQVPAKIIIGGAVITKEYAKEIGADGYSSDAADAVKLVQRLLNVS